VIRLIGFLLGYLFEAFNIGWKNGRASKYKKWIHRMIVFQCHCCAHLGAWFSWPHAWPPPPHLLDYDGVSWACSVTYPSTNHQL